jgi:hypothetical protein
MNTRQQCLFLIQVALPFVALALWKHPGFYLPVGLIILGLPFATSRRWLIARWIGLGVLMGKIISPIVLSFIYYLGLTPLALLRRLVGSDELRLRKPANTNLKTVEEPMTPARFDDLW